MNFTGHRLLTLPLRSALLILASLSSGLAPAQDAHQLQKFVNEAIKAGGGTVTVPPGIYVLQRGVAITDAKNLRIIGMDRERCILKLAPLAFAQCAQDTPAGATELIVSQAPNVTAGMKLQIEAPKEENRFAGQPHHLASVQAVERDRLVLTAPLPFPVPAKTVICHAETANLIELHGACDDILIRNLTLDGGCTADAPSVRGDAQRCAVFAAGRHSLEKGPAGPKGQGLAVEDCIIQNGFGRGLAFFSVTKCRVERCTIMDTNNAAVSFGRFTEKCEARGNHITRSGVAFEIHDASDCLIIGNEVRDCGTGVNLWRESPLPALNEGHRIFNNAFRNIADNAVQLGDGTRLNVVSHNDITGCGQNGIVARGERQKVESNRISEVKLKEVAE